MSKLFDAKAMLCPSTLAEMPLVTALYEPSATLSGIETVTLNVQVEPPVRLPPLNIKKVVPEILPLQGDAGNDVACIELMVEL